jgi:hypothetical protein
MAFDLDNFDKASQEGLTNVPRLWSYKSTTDAIAAIDASAYFNSQIDKLKVGDFIFVNASDANQIIVVTSVTTNVTTAVIV